MTDTKDDTNDETVQRLCRAIEELQEIQFSYRGKFVTLRPGVVYRKTPAGPAFVAGVVPMTSPGWSPFTVSELLSIKLTGNSFLPDAALDPKEMGYEHIICAIE